MFSDVDGKETGVIEIVEKNGELLGRLIAASKPGFETGLCEVCSGERHNRPMKVCWSFPVFAAGVMSGKAVKSSTGIWEGLSRKAQAYQRWAQSGGAWLCGSFAAWPFADLGSPAIVFKA